MTSSIRRSLWRWMWGDRHALMMALVMGVAAGVYWNSAFPPMHESTIELYLSEPFRTSEEAESMTLKPTNGLVRLYHDATGDAILQRLSRSFDLPSRYGLHADVPERERIAVQMLRGRIQAHTTMFESLRLTVRDQDRHVASSLARLLYLEIKTGLEQRAIQQVRRTAAQYEQIGSAWAVEAERERSALAAFLAASGPSAKGSDHDLVRLNQVASQTEIATTEQARMRGNLWRMQALATSNQMPELLLVQDASLDGGPSLRVTASLRVAGMVVICMCIMLFARALIRMHRRDVVGLIDMLAFDSGQEEATSSNGHQAPLDGGMAVRRPVAEGQSR